MGELVPGSIPYTILLYSVSEPGEWREDDIVEDLVDCDVDQVRSAVDALAARGLIHRNSTDRRLWPLRAGREFLARAGA